MTQRISLRVFTIKFSFLILMTTLFIFKNKHKHTIKRYNDFYVQLGDMSLARVRSPCRVRNRLTKIKKVGRGWFSGSHISSWDYIRLSVFYVSLCKLYNIMIYRYFSYIISKNKTKDWLVKKRSKDEFHNFISFFYNYNLWNIFM